MHLVSLLLSFEGLLNLGSLSTSYRFLRSKNYWVPNVREPQAKLGERCGSEEDRKDTVDIRCSYQGHWSVRFPEVALQF